MIRFKLLLPLALALLAGCASVECADACACACPKAACTCPKDKCPCPKQACPKAQCPKAQCPKAQCPKAQCPKAACASLTAPNTLSPGELSAGWRLLWDGQTTKGWVGERDGLKKFPAKGWEMKDGVLTVYPCTRITSDGKWEKLPANECRGGGGDLVTEQTFKDFAFQFDFRLTRAGNSGVKYFYNAGQFKGTCEEYQVLDSAHPDSGKPNRRGVHGTHRVAALYDLMPAPAAEGLLRPTGEWNTGMIVSKGAHVEHWLNGVKVLEYERGSADFRARVADSKYAKEAQPGERWGEAPAGRIKLQDHGDSTVSFRNLKIREF